MKIIAYNHTHWDREWYKTFQEFRMRFAEVMDLIIQEIRNENIECFYLDGQTVILEDYFKLYPERKDLIKELIRQDKIIIGPWYALADEFLVSGESLFRNMQIGIKQAKELGCEKFLGYLPDSFGHSSEIPRILSVFGIKNAVLWRGAGSQKSEFIWKSQDNSSVTATYLIEGYFQNYLHYENLSVEEKASKLKEFLDNIKKYSASDYILLPIGGDHLGPVLNLKDLLGKIQELLIDYTFENGGIFEYLERTKSTAGLSEFKNELRDNSRNPILPGTLSTRLYLKQANAVSTWKLSKLAEPFYSFLQNSGYTSPKTNELEYAWKLLLKNHPHDSICGCSVDEVHDEMMHRFAQVNQICDGLVLRGQNAISMLVKEGSIWVYNASDYEYSGVVKVKSSKEISGQFIKSAIEFPKEILLDTQRPPFSEDMEEFKEYLVYAENIPPHSIKIIDKTQPDKVEITEKILQNSRIKIEINSDGLLKLTDFELNKAFSGMHYFYDRQDTGDTYNYAPLENDIPLISKFLKSEVVEKGNLRSTLRLFYKIGETEITTDISLASGSKRAEFTTNWENKTKDHILQVKFAFEEKVRETFAENTFGIIKREFDSDYSLSENFPIKKGVELRTNTAPMQRFVWTNGLGIITEGLPEYGVSENELYVTILRSVGKLSKLSMNTRNFPAGPPLDTPGAQCLGNHTVKYAICVTETPEELFKESDEFFGSTIADVGTSKSSILEEKSFLNINNENIYTYAATPSELRLMNLSENEQRINLWDEEIVFKPYELKNILVKKDK